MRFVTTTGGYQQITGLNTVKTLTVPDGVTACMIQVESQDVRMRADGTNPTSSVGLLLSADQMYFFSMPTIGSGVGGGLASMVFIEAAPSAKLNVHYVL